MGVWQWISEASKFIGRLAPVQKILGWPGASDDAWSRKTNDTNQVIRLDDGNFPMVFDRCIKPSWLAGMYGRDNGTVDVQVVQHIITYMRYLIDSYYQNRNMSDASIGVMTSINNATSAAEYTHTVPAGHMHKMIFAAMSNATRAPNPYLDMNVSGAHSFIANTNNGTAANVCPVVGGRPSDDLNVMDGPIDLNAGDTFTMGDGNFVAADGMTWILLYKDYTL